MGNNDCKLINETQQLQYKKSPSNT